MNRGYLRLVSARTYSALTMTHPRICCIAPHKVHAPPFTSPPVCPLSTVSWFGRFRKRSPPRPAADGLDPTDQLVFSNDLQSYLFSAYSALCLSTVIVAAITVRMYWDLYRYGIEPSTVAIDDPLIYATLGNFFGVALLAATRYLMSRMFIRIYYNPTTERFTGVEYTWRLGKRRMVFAPGEVRQLDVSANGWMRDLKGNYAIRDRPYFLSVNQFKSPLYYNIMMGYVRPKKGIDR